MGRIWCRPAEPAEFPDGPLPYGSVLVNPVPSTEASIAPTIVDLLRQRAAYRPHDRAFTFLVDGETEELNITYAELDRKARAVGAWLASQGMAGKRVLLLYPSGLDFIAAFMGCLYGGAIAVPAYPPRKNRSVERIEAIAADADAGRLAEPGCRGLRHRLVGERS